MMPSPNITEKATIDMSDKSRSMAARTWMITVTYGDRFALLDRVINAALSNGVDRVIVVDNGSAQASRRRLKSLEADLGDSLEVIDLKKNQGSAAGYKAGLERVSLAADCEYVWLLDDDNLPLPGALDALLNHYQRSKPSETQDLLALHSIRADHVGILGNNRSVRKLYPRRSTFFDFDVFEMPRKVLNKLKPRSEPRNSVRVLMSTNSDLNLPFASYGGMFFHKNLLNRIGYPDERFFVYCDDREYTYRLTQDGGSIQLVPESVIEDIEPYWGAKAKGIPFFSRLLMKEAEFQIYYTVRNHAFFDKYHWCESRWRYLLNRYFFLCILKLVAVLGRKRAEFALVRKAMLEGESGLLGRREDGFRP